MWKVRNTAAILILIYSKQSFMQICYKFNERRAFLHLFLFWIKSCRNRPQRRTHCTCQKLLRAAVSVCRPLHLTPSPHPSFRLTCTHSHAVAGKHTNTLSEKHPMNHDKLPFEGALFTRPLRVIRRNRTRVCFSHINLHAVKRTASRGQFSWVGLLTPRGWTWARALLNTHSWVSEWVCVGFFFFVDVVVVFIQSCVLSIRPSIFHTKADSYSYLLRAKQIDMTVHVSFIWRRRGAESFHTHTHTNTHTYTHSKEALVLADSSGMGNAQWTFVICVSGCRLPGCSSAASDRSERPPVRHIIPAFHQAQPIHIRCPPAWVCARVCVGVFVELGYAVAFLFAGLASDPGRSACASSNAGTGDLVLIGACRMEAISPRHNKSASKNLWWRLTVAISSCDLCLG